MAGLLRVKRHGERRAHRTLCGFAGGGVYAACNVKRNFNCRGRIYFCGNLIERGAEFAGKARAEKGVNNDVGAADKFVNFLLVCLPVEYGNSGFKNTVIHIFGFVGAGGSAAKDYYYICALFKKLAGYPKAVAAVISAVPTSPATITPS